MGVKQHGEMCEADAKQKKNQLREQMQGSMQWPACMRSMGGKQEHGYVHASDVKQGKVR